MPLTRALSLPCRYYRVYTDPDVPCVEKNFGFVHRTLPLPVEQTALVLVDVWSTHYIASWLARAAAVTRGKIVPALDAARRIGMTVIHGPSPFVADRYARAPAPFSEDTVGSGSGSHGDGHGEWPPADFRGIYRGGHFAAFGRDQEPRLSEAMERYKTELDIAPAVRPLPGEPIIHTGAQMHALLVERRILHLVYAGFATNWCVIGRDYGVIAMNERDYNIILLRDATTGIEFHDSADSLAATAMTIREIETKYGWTTEAEAFVASCGGVSDA